MRSSASATTGSSSASAPATENIARGEAADTTVNVPYLDTIMYLLGISREEIEAADAEAGIVTPSPPV